MSNTSLHIQFDLTPKPDRNLHATAFNRTLLQGVILRDTTKEA